MAKGEDTRHHPARRVDRDSATARLSDIGNPITQEIYAHPDAQEPLITEEITPGGSRLRRIGSSYTSYVQSPEGGHKPAPKNWRAMRGNMGLPGDVKPEY